MITDDPSPLLDPPLDAPAVAPIGENAWPETQIAGTPAQPKLWGVLAASLTWILSVLFLVFVPLILVIPYFIYLFTKSGPPTAEALVTDKTFLFLSILGVIPAHLMTLGVVWAVVTKWGKYPFWQTVGFTWPAKLKPWKTIVFTIVTASILLVIGSAVTYYFGGEKTALDQLIESSFQARLATAFLAFATGPLIEELVYRGVLYPAVARVTGIAAAVAIVSVLFAGVHVYQYQNNLAVIAVIALLSLVLTTTRALTGSVLPSFIIHLVFNGVQAIIIVLQPLTNSPEKVAPKPAPAYELVLYIFRHLV